MTIDIQQVQPGELITADFINDVLGALDDLDARVAALEAGGGSPPSPNGAIVITDVTPKTLREGDDLTITGRNFGPTMGASAVTFDGSPPDLFRKWTDTEIVCVVPGIGTSPPPETGVSVTVEVSNFLTSQSRIVTVKPRLQQQTGSLGLELEDVSPDPITAGTNNDFKISLTSHARLATTAVISATVGGQSWSPQILNDAKGPVGQNPIGIQPEETKVLYVRIPIPTGTNQASFDLEVTATAPELDAASTSPLSFKVGDFADPDTSFTMVPTKTIPSTALSGSTVTAKASGPMTEIYFDVEFGAPGKYFVMAETVPSSAAGWTIMVADPSPDGNGNSIINIAQADGTHKVQETVEIDVLPAAATTTSAQLRLHVKEQNATKSRTYTFDLVAKA